MVHLHRRRRLFPAGYDYARASSLDECLAALAEDPDETRVLAGGQSLIPMMKLRFAFPERLVDINGLDGLGHIRRDNGHVAIGALDRHADVVRSDVVSGAVAAAAPWIADPLVRNRGTLVGSVAHCDPEGDWNGVLMATGATVVATSTSGSREIDIRDFVVDVFTNALEDGEMVTEVRVPVPQGRSGGSYLKLERKIGDYATVGVATHLELDDAGAISRAGIGMTAVVPHSRPAVEAEQLLAGEQPSDELFAEAAEAAAAASEPRTDVRGTAEWKRNIVRVYVRRGLAASRTQATGASTNGDAPAGSHA